MYVPSENQKTKGLMNRKENEWMPVEKIPETGENQEVEAPIDPFAGCF